MELVIRNTFPTNPKISKLFTVVVVVTLTVEPGIQELPATLTSPLLSVNPEFLASFCEAITLLEAVPEQLEGALCVA